MLYYLKGLARWRVWVKLSQPHALFILPQWIFHWCSVYLKLWALWSNLFCAYWGPALIATTIAEISAV